MRETSESLATAFDRIADFQAVQAGSGPGQMQAAVNLLQESVGIGDDERVVVRESLEEIGDTRRAPGQVLLGIIVGLMAAEER